ncbi:hypothetical protein VTL71DRAFT_1125 [Oculimacula yallundae]|uniref:Uncharacterized protein n=1 Tax=Oculimacula yallundae TaxID=86028 RepID=A0ABR4D1Y7_9HELO
MGICHCGMDNTTYIDDQSCLRCVCICIGLIADTQSRPAPPHSLPCFCNEFMHREGLFAFVIYDTLSLESSSYILMFSSFVNGWFLCAFGWILHGLGYVWRYSFGWIFGLDLGLIWDGFRGRVGVAARICMAWIGAYIHT